MHERMYMWRRDMAAGEGIPRGECRVGVEMMEVHLWMLSVWCERDRRYDGVLH